MYETGIAFSLLLSLISGIRLALLLNSTLSRNLTKIGWRISWLSHQPKPIYAGEWSQSNYAPYAKALLLVVLGLVASVLSWLNVVFSAAQLWHGYAKDWGAPESVKEIRWKLKNIDLPRREIFRYMHSMVGDPSIELDKYIESMEEDMRERGVA